jgi:hypothetical protein
MRDLQARANRCNLLLITRNEQIGGSSPLVGSFESAYEPNTGSQVSL